MLQNGIIYMIMYIYYIKDWNNNIKFNYRTNIKCWNSFNNDCK